MLQDLVVAAVNEALRTAEELQSKAASAGPAGFDPSRRSTCSAAWAGWAASAAASRAAARRAGPRSARR